MTSLEKINNMYLVSNINHNFVCIQNIKFNVKGKIFFDLEGIKEIKHQLQMEFYHYDNL